MGCIYVVRTTPCVAELLLAEPLWKTHTPHLESFISSRTQGTTYSTTQG